MKIIVENKDKLTDAAQLRQEISRRYKQNPKLMRQVLNIVIEGSTCGWYRDDKRTSILKFTLEILDNFTVDGIIEDYEVIYDMNEVIATFDRWSRDSKTVDSV